MRQPLRLYQICIMHYWAYSPEEAWRMYCRRGGRDGTPPKNPPFVWQVPLAPMDGRAGVCNPVIVYDPRKNQRNPNVVVTPRENRQQKLETLCRAVPAAPGLRPARQRRVGAS